MTKDEYERLVLKTADDDGKLDPPAVSNWWVGTSILIGMYMRGLVERRGPEKRMYERTGPWYITERGRAAASLSQEKPHG
jgi:hypothetical protein